MGGRFLSFTQKDHSSDRDLSSLSTLLINKLTVYSEVVLYRGMRSMYSL